MPLSAAFALAVASSIHAPELPGRPPTGPLSREDARRYDISFEVRLSSDSDLRARDLDTPVDLQLGPGLGQRRSPWRNRVQTERFDLESVSFAMPVAAITTWSRTDLTSLRTRVWGDDGELPPSAYQRDLSVSLPFGVQAAITDLPPYQGVLLRWETSYQAIVWASGIDDAAAVNLDWPESYPEEVAPGLAPQRYIESGHPDFRAEVTNLFGDDVTAVPPYVAAKRIAAYVADNFQVTHNELLRYRGGRVSGFDIAGARRSLESGSGTDADMVCVTVALMKAAGIPARPVIGLWEEDEEDGGDDVLDTWLEFYLHGAGWVPVNIEQLNAVNSWRNAGPDEAWPEFGTWDDLNERIPLAFDFVPAGWDVSELPAVYGWFADPPPVRTGYPQQFLEIEIQNRGRVR